MRIVFLGTGEIGLPSLEALLNSLAHDVVAVVTQPDKRVGRKQMVTPPAIKVRAEAAGVPVLQPEKIRLSVDELAAYRADVFVVVAYGQLLPRTVLDIPVKGCLNIHASLLPRHRGASPIQAAIREGDEESGITIMWMDEGLDTGDVLLQDSLTIVPEETGGSLHDRLALLAPDTLERALAKILEGDPPKVPQDETQATHSRKLERIHGKIDWTASAESLERLIRAYNPWPGTYTLLKLPDGASSQLKIHSVAVVEDGEACPVGGTVLTADSRLLVSCGTGVLELLEVQLEGRKRLAAAEFLRGLALQSGDVLG